MTNREKKGEPRELIKRLTYEVHGILRRADQEFRDPHEHDEHFDVDAVLSGKASTVRRSASRNYAAPVRARGALIPHTHLFKSVVRAHQ